MAVMDSGLKMRPGPTLTVMVEPAADEVAELEAEDVVWAKAKGKRARMETSMIEGDSNGN